MILCVSAETKALMLSASVLKQGANVDVAMSHADAFARIDKATPSVVLVIGTLASAAFVAEVHQKVPGVQLVLQAPSESGLDSNPAVFAVLDPGTPPADMATLVFQALGSSGVVAPPPSSPQVPAVMATAPSPLAAAGASTGPTPTPARGTTLQIDIGVAAVASAWALLRTIKHVDCNGAVRSMKHARHVLEILRLCKVDVVWPGEVAALVADIGRVALAPAIREKIDRGQSLGPHEKMAIKGTHAVMTDIVKRLPGGDQVLVVIEQSSFRFDGTGAPVSHTGERIAAGARALKLAVEYERLSAQAMRHEEIMAQLRADEGRYDPRMLGAVDEIETPPAPEGVGEHSVKCVDLKAGMIVEEPLLAVDGSVVVSEGTVLSESDIGKILTLAKARRVRESMLVRMST